MISVFQGSGLCEHALVCPVSWEMLELNVHGTSLSLLLRQSLAATLSFSRVAVAHLPAAFLAMSAASSLQGGSVQVADTPLIWDSYGLVLLPALPLSFKTRILDLGCV